MRNVHYETGDARRGSLRGLLAGVARRLALSAALCAGGTAFASPPAVPGMEAGREVWIGSCGLCHAEPDSGAPLITDKAAWASRLEKGIEALHASALGGLVGPDGDEMPARGGNPSLSDEEVKAAVDYMVAVVRSEE